MWKARAVNLSSCQQEVLAKIAHSRSGRSDHRKRAELILLYNQGYSNIQAGKRVGMSRRTAELWRKRWLANQDKLIIIETQAHNQASDWMQDIKALLNDLPRSGAKPTFKAEQIAQILAVACEDPQASGLPLSHWTLTALQREVIKRHIVESISTSRLQVFLKSWGIKTTQGGRVDSHVQKPGGLRRACA